MATQLLSDVDQALAAQLGPKVYEQYNRSAILMRQLPKEVADDGGKSCTWDVDFDGATATTYTEGADIASGDLQQDIPENATLPWGYYRSAFGTSSLNMAVARASRNSPSKLWNMFEKNLSGSLSKTASVVNTACFSGTGATAIVGADTALAATGTYAGLSKATYSTWAGKELANGSVDRALTKALIDQLEQQVYDACGEPPDLWITTSTTARKYEGLFESDKRFIVVNPGELSVANGGSNSGPNWNVRAGETGLHYKGYQLFRDIGATAGHLYAFNRKYCALKFLPAFDPIDVAGSESKAMEMGLIDETGAPIGAMAHFTPLAVMGSSRRGMVEVFLQLAMKRPGACGYISDIDET